MTPHTLDLDNVSPRGLRSSFAKAPCDGSASVRQLPRGCPLGTRGICVNKVGAFTPLLDVPIFSFFLFAWGRDVAIQ